VNRESIRESLLEILLLVKVCFTTFWFWLPALFAAYLIFQYYLVFFVHPLTLLILPTVIFILMSYEREKRTKIRYGLYKKRYKLNGRNPVLLAAKYSYPKREEEEEESGQRNGSEDSLS